MRETHGIGSIPWVSPKYEKEEIDVMILSDRKINWKEKAKIRWRYFERFGEQKLDIICFTFDEKNTFKELLLEEGVRL